MLLLEFRIHSERGRRGLQPVGLLLFIGKQTYQWKDHWLGERCVDWTILGVEHGTNQMDILLSKTNNGQTKYVRT